jgi:membrane-associated phospholipid phosphatase
MSGNARADEPWYRGKYGRNRVTHLIVTGGVGLGYLATVTFLSDPLSPDTCRWCEPPGFDRAARNALVWDDMKRAGTLSNISAYVASPIVAIGLLIASERDASASRLIDDVLPVMETVAISQLATNFVKIAFARERPYAHFKSSSEVTTENNLSFWSGHSSLALGLTTSAGLIAHWRGYATEPYIWGAGLALSISTEYLRIAADRHYLSDVLVGGFVGVGAGLLIPRLMRRDLQIVPVANGIALAGSFE